MPTSSPPFSPRQASRSRLFKEYKEVLREATADSEIRLICDENNIYKWAAYIKGPDDTPYVNGSFQLSLSVPEQYPLVPPTVKFVTRIFHPNVHFKVQVASCLLEKTPQGSQCSLNLGVSCSSSPPLLLFIFPLFLPFYTHFPPSPLPLPLSPSPFSLDTRRSVWTSLKAARSPAWMHQSVCQTHCTVLELPIPAVIVQYCTLLACSRR